MTQVQESCLHHWGHHDSSRDILMYMSSKCVFVLLYIILYSFLVSIFCKVKSIYFVIFVIVFVMRVIIVRRVARIVGLVCGVCGVSIQIRKYLR